jgi:hypothetical protein
MLRKLAGIGLLCWVFTLPAWGGDYGIFIRDASLIRRNDAHFINAEVEYQLGPTALEALENGVPLTLLLEFSIRRVRDYWLDETLLDEQRRIQLRYHPLAKTYQIRDQVSGAMQSFASLSTVLDTLSRVRGWQIDDSFALDPGQRYVAALSMRLDIESLPLPLRAIAYFTPDWHLLHPSFEWLLDP